MEGWAGGRADGRGAFHYCPSAMTGLLNEGKTICFSDLPFDSPSTADYHVWVRSPVGFRSEKAVRQLLEEFMICLLS